MQYVQARSFEMVNDYIAQLLTTFGRRVEGSTRWQGQQITGKPEMVPIELENVIFEIPMANTVPGAQQQIGPNLPWAEKHFNERVCGLPLNPPPSAAEWPFAQAGHKQHTDHWGQFSHTYPERFWPKHAGHPVSGHCDGRGCETGSQAGIRFQYGDLEDVVSMLHTEPDTRQAFLPIWFPEDTGAVDGQRVPCTLGYHFMIREKRLNVTYLIRAVDFVRHFRDDVYMATRLAQWVRSKLWERQMLGLEMGTLTMHTISMHCFAGDMHALEQYTLGIRSRESQRLLRSLG